MKLNEYILEIEKFLKDYLEKTHMDTYVLGLSGGVDSSLCACLALNAVGRERLKVIMMPINSNPADLNDAMKLATLKDLDYIVVDATETYNQYVSDMKKAGVFLSRDTLSNLKARIRMCILYAYAQEHRGLVIGTDNKDERFTGYFSSSFFARSGMFTSLPPRKGSIITTGIPFAAAYLRPLTPAWAFSSM